jgi:hypothetical protein
MKRHAFGFNFHLRGEVILEKRKLNYRTGERNKRALENVGEKSRSYLVKNKK